MKTLRLIPVISMLIVPLAAMGQVTTLFNDTFAIGGLSTLNPTAASPGTLTSTRTAYDIASSKNATAGTTITSGKLALGGFSSTSGYAEAQALFTNSPVALNIVGQSIEVYYVFTDTLNNFNGVFGNNGQISIGLYNSGGSAPTNGTLLWNSGLASGSSTAVNGGVKNWLGYCSEIAYSASAANSSAVYTRPAQTGANNLNQGLCPVSGYASAVTLGNLSGVVGQPALTVGNQYTVDLKITYVNATTLAITNTLYVGAGNGGSVFSSGGFTARYGSTATGANMLTSTFDGLCIGFRQTATPSAVLETNWINNVTVLLLTPVAPNITGLTDQTIVQGSNTVLNPTITGVPSPTYQWFVSADSGATSNSIAGETNATLTLANVQYSQNNYQYSLVAANSLGTNVAAMTLSVIVKPGITGLFNQAVYPGSTVTINPSVSGVPAPTLQWLTNGVPVTDGTDANGSIIAGSTTGTLSITNVQIGDTATYSLVASNSAGIVTNSMYLLVSASDVLPVLVGPANITVIQGNDGTFSASTYYGLPQPTLQWLDQTGTPIVDATNISLTLSSVQYSQDGYVYSLIASNSVGSVTNTATLTVIVPPAITNQPASLTVTNTQSASFTVGATGVPAVAYQWNKSGNPIPGATSATYTIASASPSDIATYSCTITNLAGTTNSVDVTLTVNSLMSATAFAPTNGATGLCYDTPLSITFSSTPTLRTNGMIKIFNVTNSTTPVDTINLALSFVTLTFSNYQPHSLFPGDNQGFNYYPVVIAGSTATIYPHGGVMTSNQTYYVTIDDGCFADASGAYFAGIAATNTWQFTTKLGGPVDPVNPSVNADGSADFVTVQGAVDSLALNAGGARRTINIRNGTYFEIVDVAGKTNVTLRGQSRTGTIIKYPDNANIAPGGTTHARMTFKVNANDVVLDTLTISNSTPQGGGQAEALTIDSGAQRCIVFNSEIDSRQDTILANVNSSQVYFYKCIVKGNFDYIWGGGNLYFDQCTIITISGTGSGQLTAARTDTSATQSANFPWLNPGGTYTANGMSFVGCSFQSEPGLGNITLAGSNGTAGNNVSWYGCDFATNYVAPSASLFSGNFVFWQDLNTSNGIPVTYPVVTSISGTDPRLLAATNIPTWFYGWQPQLAPNILTNPVGQSISGGGAATFTVAATGIPTPTYQWLKNGNPIAGQTAASLTISSASANDAAAYSVIVSNSAAAVTSSSANLTVSNTAPSFTPVSDQTVNVGVNVSVANAATDPDVPAQTLTFTIPVAPTGAAVDGSGNFTWRPTVSFAGTSNPVKVVVTDNGTPNLSATNSFNVIVNPLTQPNASSSAYSGGQFTVTVSGQIGPDYELQGTTNLAGGTWTPIATTNSPASSPFILTDPNAGTQPVQFYRIVTGPPLP